MSEVMPPTPPTPAGSSTPGPVAAETDAASAPSRSQPVPTGYRQGLITAISVLLGFSLGFWKYWGLESPGDWTAGSFLVAVSLVIAVMLQIVALFRSLRVEDDYVPEYRKTVRWLVASAVLLLIALFGAILDDYIGSHYQVLP